MKCPAHAIIYIVYCLGTRYYSGMEITKIYFEEKCSVIDFASKELMVLLNLTLFIYLFFVGAVLLLYLKNKR